MNEGLFGNIMLTCLVLGLASSVASAISGRMFADNEDDDEWYDIILNALKTTSIESLNMVPFGQNITDVINGVVYYDTNLISTINNLRKVAQKKADERTPHQLSRAVISFANEFSQLAGVPIIGAGRKIFNGFTDSEMEFNPGELVNSATGDWVRRIFN